MTGSFPAVFAGRSVLVTGHTGFKGAWLTFWLTELGARVTGLALAPNSQSNLFTAAELSPRLARHVEGDIGDARLVADVVKQSNPDVVFHLAAQSLVLESYRRPRETFETNVLGTANLLEAIREAGRSCAVLVVTSDKCYANGNEGRLFREADPLGGADPYSASKAAAEMVAAAYRQSFFPPERLSEHGVQLATVRGGNVLGGGDWAADRIVPDIVRALQAGQPVNVRNPHAVRPWQHVLDVLNGYLTLAGSMLGEPHARWCTAWNFGPRPARPIPVREVVEQFLRIWGAGEWRSAQAERSPYEAAMLQLCIDKALAELPWQPRWDGAATIERTARWYHAFHCGEDPRQLCSADLTALLEASAPVAAQAVPV